MRPRRSRYRDARRAQNVMRCSHIYSTHVCLNNNKKKRRKYKRCRRRLAREWEHSTRDSRIKTYTQFEHCSRKVFHPRTRSLAYFWTLNCRYSTMNWRTVRCIRICIGFRYIYTIRAHRSSQTLEIVKPTENQFPYITSSYNRIVFCNLNFIDT